MGCSTNRTTAVALLAAALAACVPAQTKLFDASYPSIASETGFGASVAFGWCENPGNAPRRVVATGISVYPITGKALSVFDGAGASVFSAIVPGGAAGAPSIACGRVATGLTSEDAVLLGVPENDQVWFLAPFQPGGVLGLSGTQAGESFGHSLAVIGDITGDGIEDFVVGAPTYDVGASTDRGRVRVYAGTSGPPFTLIREHVGIAANYQLGWSVAGVGDVTGDGVPDYAMSAPGYGSSAGRIYTYSGATGTQVGSLTQTNGTAGEQYGYALAGLGDVNQDGVPDLAVGVPDFGNFPGLGRVQVLSGQTGATIFTLPGGSVNGHLGASVAGGGDVDRDGVPDLVTGAPDAGSAKGQARVYSGKTGTILYLINGAQGGEALGAAVALGQVNADGYAEFAVGRPSFDDSQADSGRVSVYTGANRWRFDWEYVFPSGNPPSVRCVDVAGDVNGDGVDDFIVCGHVTGASEPGWRIHDGRTSQILRQALPLGVSFTTVTGLADVTGDGKAEFIVADAVTNHVEVRGGLLGNVLPGLSWTGSSGNYGHSVADAGDLDGDGFHDVIIGVPYYQLGGTPSGWVTIRSGATGAILEDHGGTSGSNLGWSVAGAGDVNGDNVEDYIEGAPKFILGGSEAGRVQVKSGATNTVLATAWGQSGQDGHFGSAVDGLGDVNGDGYDDIIVGEPEFDGVAGGSCGRARVFLGTAGSGMQLHYSIEGQAQGDHFGTSVAALGDVDGDGRNDFAVGAPEADMGSLSTGVVRVYSGQTGAVLFERFGAQSERFGSLVGGARTAGADGRNELVVGSIPPVAFGPTSYSLLQLPEATTVTVGPGCGGPLLLTGTGSCAGNLSGCSVPTGSPLEAPGLPILGEVLELKVSNATPAGLFYGFASIGPTVLTPVGGGCTAYLDLGNLIQMPPIPLDGAGSVTIPVYVPWDPNLVGLSAVVQGLTFPAGGGFALTNAIRIAVGFANHTL